MPVSSPPRWKGSLVGLADSNGNQFGPANPIPMVANSGGGAAGTGAQPYVFTPLGYQQIASFSGAVSLTVPSGAAFAVISAETQALRYRDDGVVPTASVGQPLLVSGATQPFIYSGNLAAIQFIPVSGTATLDISYYK
jgi:hypothetical protein